jgi:Fe-S-cluster-containing dehydrogenase component
MAVMAIFQDVDKCMRCNGCVVSCKRTWQMKGDNPGVLKTSPDTRVIIKSQKRVDMGPFMRYSCWHCTNPPCIKRCPFKALAKKPNGAVMIDPNLCQPGGTNASGVTCVYQCQTDCGRGGYPKIGEGSDLFASPKAWKCTMCYGRAGAEGDLDPAYGFALPTKESQAAVDLVAEKAHQPSCVYTCPAKAMAWDTRDNILAYIGNPANKFISAVGDGSVYWASRKALLLAPKADPFVEDHVTPLLSSVLSGPFAKAALVPAALGAGLFALISRRQSMAESVGEV